MCSANGQAYVFSAGSGNEALAWIQHLQDKREEFIKVSSALQESALEQEKDRRTLKALNRNVGALAIEIEEEQKSQTAVRRIVRSKIR